MARKIKDRRRKVKAQPQPSGKNDSADAIINKYTELADAILKPEGRTGTPASRSRRPKH